MIKLLHPTLDAARRRARHQTAARWLRGWKPNVLRKFFSGLFLTDLDGQNPQTHIAVGRSP
ncbi:hypothetical protein FJV83_29205 [Mesorhizobium sp. WSM4307]|uniref:hypothetical protein n=1 Tax=unclassified Mesorhizobium TaxID=325217 RepID=UPI00115DF690|nr:MULTISPECIES: hypothetical protein [unclassified Mesorhizobium]TRC73920.1 hypothetical protein FJV80_30100 [Mesorhizobium sp. WSM4310]TRC78145.1 hypothetical protein FJV81_11450 [Mesorhizobium sp. WSM4315]TRC79334.1 hypothetical protein FJV83_29205 [Mesorhizobium sp. WSM4307]